MKVQKTNAARLLDSAKINYELIPYIVDENDLSAVHVASQLREPVELVFKTLVLRGNKTGIFICVIPGNDEVDLKKASAISGNKNCDLVHMKEILSLTGYIRGGCSPLGMKKKYPTFVHLTCTDYPFIYISAGIRGMQIKINPYDLLNVSKGQTGDLILQ